MASPENLSNQLMEDIIERTRNIGELDKQVVALEKEKSEKLKELKKLRKNSLTADNRKEFASSRNRVIRQLLSEVDESTVQDFVKIQRELKTYFKRLGLRVETRDEEERENLILVDLHLEKHRDHIITLVYDTVTEDYDCKFIS